MRRAMRGPGRTGVVGGQRRSGERHSVAEETDVHRVTLDARVVRRRERAGMSWREHKAGPDTCAVASIACICRRLRAPFDDYERSRSATSTAVSCSSSCGMSSVAVVQGWRRPACGIRARRRCAGRSRHAMVFRGGGREFQTSMPSPPHQAPKGYRRRPAEPCGPCRSFPCRFGSGRVCPRARRACQRCGQRLNAGSK